ncbi:MAG TPA: phosphatase PAP2 family protein [Xanthobacteraceae bacterium]
MSVSGPFSRMAANHSGAVRRVRANVAGYLDLFRRRPRATATPLWRAPSGLATGAILLIAIIAGSMLALDARAVPFARRLPEWVIRIFDHVTDLGKSVWLLVPIAFALALIALLASPHLARISRCVLAAIAVRLGFLFVAIGLPGLIFTIAKRLIGRGRPLVGGSVDPFHYRPLGWSVEYASLPSGHAVDAFAIAMAIGALWPRARPLLWIYAVTIAVSRVVLTAHFASDVIAGAAVGIVGVLLLRDWFAARGLAFVIGPDGIARPLPGPSPARIKRVARQLVAP